MILPPEAVAAWVAPSYADWLKDLSLMVPVSDITQALNLAAAAGALLDGVALGELEPHAAASRVTTPSTATLPSFCLTVTSSAGGSQRAAPKGPPAL